MGNETGQVSFTHGRSHAVRLGVDEAADLREVTVALGDELDGRGLHQEGVIGRQHAMDSLLHALHDHRLTPAVHELPHLIVRGDLGFLPPRRHRDEHHTQTLHIQKYYQHIDTIVFCRVHD